MRHATSLIALVIALALCPPLQARPKASSGGGGSSRRGSSRSIVRAKPRHRRSARKRPARETARSTKTGRRKEPVKKKRRIQRNTMTMYSVNTGERVVGLDLFETRASKPGLLFVRKDARRKLQHLARDWRTGKVHRGMPDALWFFLYLVSYHYDQPIELISGYRSRERKTSRHYQGRAIDFRVRGVSSEEVWRYAKRRFTRRGVGLGLYPRSNFMHLDIRKKTYYWIDDSSRGEEAQYRKGLAQPVDQWREANRRAARRERKRRGKKK